VPASGSLAPSLAFAVPIAARLPLGPPLGGVCMTTLTGLAPSHLLRTGQLFRPASHPASRPRTGASLPGTRMSPRTRSSLAGCLSSRSITSCHLDHSFCHGAQADGHTVELHNPVIGRVISWRALNINIFPFAKARRIVRSQKRVFGIGHCFL